MATLARPYAVAAFESAVAKQALPAWKEMLNSAALAVQDEQIAQLLDNPHVTSQQLAELLCSVLAKVLDTERKHFLCLLAENKRLPLLPDIAVLFTRYAADYEKTLDVDVISAAALDDRYRQTLAQRLAQRLQRNVSLHCSVDPTLLGGVIVRAGDTVIDGSVRGKLNRLLESL